MTGMLTAEQKAKRDEVRGSLIRAGFPIDAVEPILHNIGFETGYSFDHTQKQSGGGGGRGLFQFDYMLPYYKKYLKDKKLSYPANDSADRQAKFVHDVIYSANPPMDLNRENKEKLRTSLGSPYISDVRETKMFSELFLQPGIPHLAERVAPAFLPEYTPEWLSRAFDPSSPLYEEDDPLRLTTQANPHDPDRGWIIYPTIREVGSQLLKFDEKLANEIAEDRKDYMTNFKTRKDAEDFIELLNAVVTLKRK